MANDEQKIQELLRDYVQAETRRPEYRTSKKAFLDAHFKPRPFFALTPVPAFAIVSVIAVSVVFALQLAQPKPEPLLREPSQEVAKPAVVEVFEAKVATPGGKVVVEKVASDVGSTMVYRKDYPDTSVTVVWVIPGVN